MPPPTTRVAVIGAGVTGAAAAFELARHRRGVDEVVLVERDTRVGGRVLTEPFAGLPAIDCGADAVLARVPDATALAVEVGIGDQLTHPEPVGAAVWYDGLHDVPDGLVLGVPGNLAALARSSLISWPGKLRAALEPLLPRTSTDDDSIGAFVRGRFGDEVHERLVDALVGSIYATDTDNFSLAEVPQLAALTADRSVLLAAQRRSQRAAGTGSAAAAPIFAAPRSGMTQLVEATVEAAVAAGAVVRTGSPAQLERESDSGWRVDEERFDAVVLATPAAASAEVLGSASADTAALQTALKSAETADVVMVTLHVAESEWPDRLSGRSGYLVPKPVQRDVTAVSFGSQKWAHWQPPAGGQILRVSLGRDGVDVLPVSDEEAIERSLADVARHLGVTFSPLEARVTRWPGAFAQYRPHHRAWVDALRDELPSGVFVAGSSFDGIGIPACVRSGRRIAERAEDHVVALAS